VSALMTRSDVAAASSAVAKHAPVVLNSRPRGAAGASPSSSIDISGVASIIRQLHHLADYIISAKRLDRLTKNRVPR
jgi:hypothetical protein